MSACQNCNKEAPAFHNFCSWECHVEHAKKLGGIVHTPNNLPIKSIRYDNLMLEHSHGDHPDYKFPVYIEYTGNDFDSEEDQIAMFGKVLSKEELLRSRDEIHALIYCDGSVALTLYEYCYSLWYLPDGSFLCGKLLNSNYKLSQSSKDKIQTWFDQKKHS